MSETGLPFDDIRALAKRLPEFDEKAARAAETRVEAAANGAVLGRLGELGPWLAGWRGRALPVMRPELALFAGTHGGAGAGEIEATKARIEWMAAGGAPTSILCQSSDVGLKLYDLALDVPTGDTRREAALDERGCAATMAFGMEAIAGGTDLFCIAAVEGGDVAAAAVLTALLGGNWTQGEDDAEAVAGALACHEGRLGNPLEVLRRVGGRETAAMAGAIIAARMERVPVILDGLAVLAAAAVVRALDPAALDHCLLAGAAGRERAAAELLGLAPLLDLGICAGEGAAAVLAAQMVRSAAQVAVAPEGRG